ncbi:MAG: glycosyltransferase family 4 protein [Clostridiaceae bacterium]
MKIGIDGRASNWYRGTGIGNYTYELLYNLNKIDYINDYLIFMPDNSDLEFNPNFLINKIKKNNTNNFWEQVNIPTTLNDNLDLYHIPQNGVGMPKEKKCPYLITLHDVIPFKMPETVSSKYLKIFNNTIPSIIEKCDGIITVSNHSKNDIANTLGFDKNKIYVTYLANENIYKPLNPSYCNFVAEKQYGIIGNYILYVGGFSPRKNILGLINAYYNLITKYNIDIKLVIAGRKGKSYGMYKERCEKLSLLDKVIFTGFIENQYLPCIYNKAKLFVYPSFYEGFGLPPLEAMACNTPVIASNTTSIPEVLGDSAYLINPYDLDELTNAMYKMLLDPKLREKYIKKGLNKVNSFNFEKTAKETLEIYKKVLKP